jgi:hypothetical protein
MPNTTCLRSDHGLCGNNHPVYVVVPAVAPLAGVSVEDAAPKVNPALLAGFDRRGWKTTDEGVPASTTRVGARPLFFKLNV